MHPDTLITGGTVHTADRSFEADVAIAGERIIAVAAPGQVRPGKGTRVIDAGGMAVCPGFIDVHVHLALPFCGTVSCDDFDSGSRAALSGGITMVIDFAIPGAGENLRDAHKNWLKKAEGISAIDYSWHMALTNRRHIEEIPAMVKLGLPTFKEFMIYESEGWNSDDAMLLATLESVKKNDGMLLVHCESSRALDLLIERHHTPELMRKFGARLHPMTRPNFIEAEAIERCIHWSSVTGGKLYVVHMSTGEGADLVKAARARGVPVLAETCAQYLCLDDSVFDSADGHLFACCPQVKKPADIARLWRGAQDGEVCIVSTDTCSFTREQKGMWRPEGADFGDWTKTPMGLPGLDTMVPVVYTHGVKAGRIGMNRLVELCSTAPARIMGMGNRKGQIAPGFDADIAILDLDRSVKIEPKRLRSRCDWSPFAGMELSGFARTTLVRGRVVHENFEPVPSAGHGVFIKRSSPGHA